MTDRPEPGIHDAVYSPTQSPVRRNARGGWTHPRLLAAGAWAMSLLVAFIVRLTRDPDASGSRGTDWTWWACIAAGVFWMAIIVPGGAFDRWRAARRSVAARRHPAEPWLTDHAWDPSGTQRTPLQRLRDQGMLPAAVMLAIVVPETIHPSGDAAVVRWIALAAMSAAAAWAVWRAYGVGTIHVSFTKFPYVPGERVTLHVGGGSDGARFESVTFTLVLVVEGPGRTFASSHQADEPLGLPGVSTPGLLPGPSQDVAVTFDVPREAGGTCLSADFPRYWTLDVEGRTTSGRYHESFLVPIYERPSPSAAA